MANFQSVNIDDLSKIQKGLNDHIFSLPELVDHYLAIAENQSALNAYIELFSAEAKERAKTLQQKMEADPYQVGALFGAVISIKDNICYKGHHLSAASKILEGFESIYSSTAVERLLAADAIIIGRTNCDEFAMGSANEHSAFGPVQNGDNPEYIPGGSSGGSAVSVQIGSCLMALGSDTGGSVRQPAAYCGLPGIKPTYGRISRYGLIAYASSFDQIGIIGRSFQDLNLCLSILAGPDEFDMSASLEPYKLQDTNLGDQKYKCCYFDFSIDHPGMNPKIRDAFRRKLEEVAASGHSIEKISFPWQDYLVPAYYVLSTAEASSNLSRYDGVRFGYRSPEAQTIEEVYEQSRTAGFGLEVKRRILLGTFVLSAGYIDAYYGQAQKVRRLISEHSKQLFQDYDMLLAPTSPISPWKTGAKNVDPISIYLADIFTVYANLVGIPAISIPIDRNPETNLSIGMQIMTKPFQESSLLQFADSLSVDRSS